jgi:hypothetical protein
MVNRSRAGSSERRFQPRIGRDFEMQEADVINARTRGFLVRAVILGAGAAMASASAYGVITGNYIATEVVWAVAGPMLGAVMTYYFGAVGKD